MKTPKQIIRQLVERWQFSDVLSSNTVKTLAGHHRPAGRPGDAIKRLPQEEQDMLKELRAEDMENERWPNSDIMRDSSDEAKERRLSKLRVEKYEK